MLLCVIGVAFQIILNSHVCIIDLGNVVLVHNDVYGWLRVAVIVDLSIPLLPVGFQDHARDAVKLSPLTIVIAVDPCPIYALNIVESFDLTAF